MDLFRAIITTLCIFSSLVLCDPSSVAETGVQDLSLDTYTFNELTTRANNFPVRAGERACVTCQVASELLVPYCPGEGTYSHFVSCKDYYVCDSVSDKPVPLTCSRRESFDKLTARCLPNKDVNCKGDDVDFGSFRNDVISYRSQTPRISLRPTKPTSFRLTGRTSVVGGLAGRNQFICTSIGLLPDPEDCEHFYSCYIGVAQRFKCPPGLLFNAAFKVCDFPYNVQCSTGTTTPAPTIQPTVRPTTRPTIQPTIRPTVAPTSPPDTSGLKRVCYYTNWAQYRPGIAKFKPENIDRYFCTHIIYAFAVLDSNTYLIKSHDPWADIDLEGYKKVTSFQEFGLKVSLAIGGWTDSAGSKYSELVASPHRRASFISHVVGFLKQHNFNGLDLDWEFPRCWQSSCTGPVADKQNFVEFVKELRVAFNRENPPLLLSAAVSANENVAGQAYDIKELSKYLDFFNVMSYDYHGSWDKKTGHVAPLLSSPGDLFSVDRSVTYFLNQGAPASKLILGFPTYGRSFTLNDPSNNGYNAPASAGAAGPYVRERGTLSYLEICSKIKNDGWIKVNGDDNRGPVAISGDQWVSYLDVQAMARFGQFVLDKGLGGAMVWALDFDDFTASCCPIASPLLSTIERLFTGVGPAIQDIIDQCSPAGVDPSQLSTVTIKSTSPAPLPNSQQNPFQVLPAVSFQQNPFQVPPAVSLQSNPQGFSGSKNDLCNGFGNVEMIDPGHCTTYVVCSNGFAFTMHCPSPLHWDDNKKYCNYPELANCNQ